MKRTAAPETEEQLTERLIKAVTRLNFNRKQMLDTLLKEWARLDFREDSRIHCFLPVDYSTPQRVYQDFINNLSSGGVFIETAAPLQVGQSISLAFSVPPLNKTFKVTGSIIRTDQDGIGVRFTKKLTVYQKELIQRAISRD